MIALTHYALKPVGGGEMSITRCSCCDTCLLPMCEVYPNVLMCCECMDMDYYTVWYAP